jgi:putative ABC transport system permease protein
MRSARTLFFRFIGLFSGTRRDRALDAELNAHLQAHIDDNLRAGLTVDQATRDARLRFGGVEMTKDIYREQRGLPMIDTLSRELRQAFERLRRSPGFASSAILSLALAIGANVSIFTVVERVVVNPLPYPDSGRLVALDFAMPSRNIPAGFNSATARQYFFYADHARTLDALAVYRTEDRTLTDRGTPERIRIARTTPSLAAVLRTAPRAGGWFAADSVRGAAPVAVVSHGLWSRRYGADPEIVGRTVTLNGIATTVVGVMPASFAFPDSRVDAWIPEPFSPAAGDDSFSFTPVARLRNGATLVNARAEIDQLSRTLDATAPNNGYGELRSTALTLQDAMVGPIAAALWTLLASTGVVLLVACANIANLFLVRSEARQREIAVRRALGAGTGGIAGYFLAESALLSLAGGALGMMTAWYGVRLLAVFGPADLPRLGEIHLAPIHAAFTLGLTALAALAFGAVPIARLAASPVDLHDNSRGTTANRRSHRVRQILMAGQIALALILLVASGLLFRSFVRLRAVDPGFNPASTLTFQIGLPRSDYPDRQRIVATHQALLDRLSALPGVAVASATNCVPLSGRGFCGGAPFFVDGDPAPGINANRPIVAIRPIAESFFEAMGMRLIRGRGLTRRDLDTNEPVAVINDTLARIAFPGQDALGKGIRLGPHVVAGLWFTIVGVVPTTPTIALAEPRPVPKMYVPMFATRDVWPAVDVMTYVVRTAVPPLGLTAAVRTALKNIDPNLALAQVRTLQDHLDAAAAPRAFTMVLILIAAGAALLLGVIGIYGVMSYIVSQRTNEIGVRLALGAQPAAVMRMIVRQGGVVACGGIAIGLSAALAGSRVISSLLYGISPRDPAVFTATTLTLLVVALAACWLPARRAASVDPLVALRAQ